MSTQPVENEQNREFIQKALTETLRKKKVNPLGAKPWKTLLREGKEGLQKRLQAIVHLLSNTYQLGIVVQSDYLHLSRSLSAMVGSYLNLYDGLPKSALFSDLGKGILFFPWCYVKDQIQSRLRRPRMAKQV